MTSVRRFCPAVESEQVTHSSQENEDVLNPDHPLASQSQKVMDMAFKFLKPLTNEGVQNMIPWRELYSRNNEGWTVKGHLHQRSHNDMLHLSCSYKPYLGNEVKFHVNCYIRNIVIVHSVTMATPSGIKLVAEFERL